MPYGPGDPRRQDPIPGLVKRWVRSERKTSAGLRTEIERWQLLQARHAADQARQRRATSLAKPRGEVHLRLRGLVEATIVQDMAVTLERCPSSRVLAVAVVPIDPIAIEGHIFEGFTVAVPDYRGPGMYDLAAVGVVAADDQSPDARQTTCSLGLDDGRHPQWRWRSDLGPVATTVGEAERTLEARLVFESSAGELVDLEATISRR
ncbi:MAG: hypothetical protein ACRD29_22295 [Acidimicrobiales bacterium]